ncbi:hypothetical protein V6Z12_D09G137200 [Gossypium hirsutum]
MPESPIKSSKSLTPSEEKPYETQLKLTPPYSTSPCNPTKLLLQCPSNSNHHPRKRAK